MGAKSALSHTKSGLSIPSVQGKGMATIRNVQPKGGFNKPYVLLKSKNMAPEVRAAKWKKPRPIAPRLRLWPRQARRQREGGAIVRTAPGDRVERAAAQVEERVDRTSFRPASAARRPPRWPRRRGARPRGEGREKGAHGPCVPWGGDLVM
jgi:hypothetical protein